MIRNGLLLGSLLLVAACATTPEPDLDRVLAGESQVSGSALDRRIAAAERHPLGSRENPVRAQMPAGQRAYLQRLRCSDGRAPTFGRIGSRGSQAGRRAASEPAWRRTTSACAVRHPGARFRAAPPARERRPGRLPTRSVRGPLAHRWLRPEDDPPPWAAGPAAAGSAGGAASPRPGRPAIRIPRSARSSCSLISTPTRNWSASWAVCR